MSATRIDTRSRSRHDAKAAPHPVGHADVVEHDRVVGVQRDGRRREQHDQSQDRPGRCRTGRRARVRSARWRASTRVSRLTMTARRAQRVAPLAERDQVARPQPARDEGHDRYREQHGEPHGRRCMAERPDRAPQHDVRRTRRARMPRRMRAGARAAATSSRAAVPATARRDEVDERRLAAREQRSHVAQHLARAHGRAENEPDAIGRRV